MQSVLQIMPEPIADVPADAKTSPGTGADERERSRFGGIFEQAVEKTESKAPADSDEAPRVDGVKADSDGKPAHQDGKSFEQGKESALTAAAKNADSEGQKDSKAAKPAAQVSALDKIMTVVEKSESLLRQPAGSAQAGDAQAHTLPHSRLSSAIESALEGSKHSERAGPGLLKLVPQGDGEGESAITLTPGKSQGQGGEGKVLPGNNAPLDIDDFLSPGIIREEGEGGDKPQSKASAENLLNGAGKAEDSDKAVKGEGKGQDKSAELTVKMGQGTPDIGKDKAGQGSIENLDDFQTPGVRPPYIKGEGADGQAAQSNDGRNTQGLSGAGQASQTRPMEVADGKSGKGGNLDLSSFQTPGIVTEGEEGPQTQSQQIQAQQEADMEQVIRPMELADSAKGKGDKPDAVIRPMVNTEQASGKWTPQQAAAQQQAESVTRPMEAAPENPFIASLKQDGKGAKADRDILGNANKAKTKVDAASAAAGAAKVDGKAEQAAMSEEANLDSLLQQEQDLTPERFAEERLRQMTGKEFVPQAEGKLAGQTPGIASPSIRDSMLSSLQSAAGVKTMADKAPEQLTQPINIHRPDFSANMKERMMVMMNKGVHTADIRLDPAELGQMQIKMSVENDVTSVSITVQNAQAKEALEQSMPKLKEMLAEQGIELGEGSVHEQSQQEQQMAERERKGQHTVAGQSADSEPDADNSAAQGIKIVNGAVGGIDFFA